MVTVSPTRAQTVTKICGRDPSYWTVVFHDEFDGTSLNSSVWDTCYPDNWTGLSGCDLRDSNEAELYNNTNDGPNKNAVLDGSGILKLRAIKDYPAGGFTYSSGMISSFPGTNNHPGFATTYGCFEARFQVVAGVGLWPAFWMLPSEQGPWPNSEIDIMENLGQYQNNMYMTYHLANGNAAQGLYSGSGMATSLHRMSVDWEQGSIKWYVDNNTSPAFSTTQGVYAGNMFVMLNLAVGDNGSWPGPPNSNTQFPADFQIDYVRVYKPAASGVPSATPQPSTTSTPMPVLGDVNHDGNVDFVDFVGILQHFNTTNNCPYDINSSSNCLIDIFDVSKWFSFL